MRQRRRCAARSPMRCAMRRTNANYNPSSLHAEGRRARAVLDAARDRVADGDRREAETRSSSPPAGPRRTISRCSGAREPRLARRTSWLPRSNTTPSLGALERLARGGIRDELGTGRSRRARRSGGVRALAPAATRARLGHVCKQRGGNRPADRRAGGDRAPPRRSLSHRCGSAPDWLPLDVETLGVDLLSLSAHKFYGPKGVGLLYVRAGCLWRRSVLGGGQESGRRSGTENLSGIVGMAAALELARRERAKRAARVASPARPLRGRDPLAGPGRPRQRRAAPPGCRTAATSASPASTRRRSLIALDLAGVAASAGSACTSGTLEPSHVLAAMARRSLAGRRASPVLARHGDDGRRRSTALWPSSPRWSPIRALASPGRACGGMGRLETNRARLEAEA